MVKHLVKHPHRGKGVKVSHYTDIVLVVQRAKIIDLVIVRATPRERMIMVYLKSLASVVSSKVDMRHAGVVPRSRVAFSSCHGELYLNKAHC